MFALINEAKQNIQGYSLQGTVGDVPFSAKNVVGNFTVSNKASNPSSFNLGNASIGQLTGTLYGLNIERNSWKGKYITPVVTIGEYNIPFPSKRYKIDDAKHSKGMVNFTAYDDMNLFEKKARISTGLSGIPFEFLSLACQECHVEFGMTRADVLALPNGDKPLTLKEMGDIETWRDVLYWIGVSCASFSFINREGKLQLKPFHNEIDDTIPSNVRYDGAVYYDDVVRYTGIYVTINEEKVSRYYAAQTDDGYTLNTGNNPFLQGKETYRKILADNIVSGISDIEYISGDIEIPFGFHYDLGDVLSFPGGSGNNKFCIMGYSFTYNGRCKLTGIPSNKKSMSKSDKNIQGLLTNTSTNETSDYEQKNTKIISVGDSERKLLIHSKIASNKDTKAMIHIEVNLRSTANTSAVEYEVEDNVIYLKDVWDGIKNTATKATITYIVNSEENALHPKESWIDGNHVMHLMYILPLEQGIVSDFSAYITAEDGTIYIERGGVWMYAMGVGLVGDGHWDGSINIEETASDWNLIDVAFESASDSVNVHTQTPVVIRLSDNTAEWNLVELTFEDADDTLNINMFTETFERITEDGTTRITEDGLTRYTEGD